jgi:hypothetical protein
MKKSILGGLAAGAVALSLAVAGPAHANQDEICGPGGCFDHLGSGVCHLIKDKYYSRDMVIRGAMRVTELRASARPMVESIIDDAIDANCPEARRLVYF